VSEKEITDLQRKLDEHLQDSVTNFKENTTEHHTIIETLALSTAAIKDAQQDMSKIEVKLEDALKWKDRVTWVTGMVLLMIGSIIGWVIHHIEWFWNILPMHEHTH